MAGPFKKVRQFFDSEAERDAAYKRKLQKDFMIATHQRVIKKIKCRNRKEGGTLYGYEVEQV